MSGHTTDDAAVERAALIAELEQAERGNAPLSERVLLACGWTVTEEVGDPNDTMWINWHDPEGALWGMGYGTIPPPNVTVSLDAALTLVPEGRRLTLEQSDDGIWWDAYVLTPTDREGVLAGPETKQGCATPALAVCAAVLRARRER